jgi:DNA-binding transcriptional LysR family regulator
LDDLTDVVVFVRVVESKSFTAAAERLGIAKSVVSKYVTRLEERLGARLLNRTTRRLSLTEAGAALYERVEYALPGKVP